MELETQVAIALDLKYLDNAKAEHLANCTAEVKRLLNGLLASVSTQRMTLSP